MKDDDINDIAGVLELFFSGHDFDIKTLGKGLGAVIEFGLTYFKSLTQTREGVGLSAFLLGIMLKQMNFKGTVDLFPITLDAGTATEDICLVHHSPFPIVLPCEGLSPAQIIKKFPAGQPIPIIAEDFGIVYVSDALMWIGLGLMLGSTAMDIIKGFIRR